ncbi:ankyrin repeat-containing domain protein [Polychytrium aggregatum]|uniref:ankyrin repeat-containing domain protein n=1 Tax=Polychytrium aggregatum TaxID=110093 RepID=UPI0022FE43CB|nr:ankyrin repeat-containing domain protein [Polychytrium aggregatum]KAI9202280.1 ankyrin repeat-containing domain protein [Polychytrium aggregatum]
MHLRGSHFAAARASAVVTWTIGLGRSMPINCVCHPSAVLGQCQAAEPGGEAAGVHKYMRARGRPLWDSPALEDSTTRNGAKPAMLHDLPPEIVIQLLARFTRLRDLYMFLTVSKRIRSLYHSEVLRNIRRILSSLPPSTRSQLLVWGAEKGNLGFLRHLLSCDILVDSPVNSLADSSQLKHPTLRGDSKLGEELSEQNLPVPTVNVHENDDQALRIAAENGHVDVVRFLLKSGANVRACFDHALRWSATFGHTEVVKTLLDHGANIHACQDYALRWASRFGHYDTVMVLLSRGADPRAKDSEALLNSKEAGHSSIAKLLMLYDRRDEADDNRPAIDAE